MKVGEILFTRHGDAIVGSENLHATFKGAFTWTRSRFVHTKVNALHHAGEHPVTVPEVILVCVDANHERQQRIYSWLPDVL